MYLVAVSLFSLFVPVSLLISSYADYYSNSMAKVSYGVFLFHFMNNKNNNDKLISLSVVSKLMSTVWDTERCSDTGKIFHCDNKIF